MLVSYKCGGFGFCLGFFFSFVSLEILLSVAIGIPYASVTARIYPTYAQNYTGEKQYSKPKSGKTSYFANDST